MASLRTGTANIPPLDSQQRQVYLLPFRDARHVSSTILIPRIALLDRPEHGFLQLLERHVIGITNSLEFLVQVIERLDRALIGNLANFRQDRSVGL